MCSVSVTAPTDMQAITISSGRTFQAQASESLLDAALRQGVVLNHSCRSGRCNSCKARVRSGETAVIHQETGLTTDEQAQGYILTCARRASSPVDLEIDDLGDISLPAAITLPCRIHSIEKMTSDVIHVRLRMPPSAAMDFLPGQYIDVIGGNGLRRSYSIANAPQSDKLIELHIRSVPYGQMSRYWFEDAKANDLLRLRGPLGTFFLRDQAGRDLVLLATGTGIAPIKAILEGLASLSAGDQPRSVSVYWGGRRPGDFYWQPEGRSALPNLRFIPVLSRASEGWIGAQGHVQDALLRDAPDLSNTLVYACGSDAMIHSAQALLISAGLPQGRFHSDAFVCSGTL
jgi:CDP-4-dehydro-6-deoxyglucose reductase